MTRRRAALEGLFRALPANSPLLPKNAATVVTGNPVRPVLFTGDRSKGIVTLDPPASNPDLPNVCITGGAQGSIADADAAIALTKDEATAERLKQALQPILTSPGRRAQMARQAASPGRPGASRRLVDIVLTAGLDPT